jgi:hypothetical protein
MEVSIFSPRTDMWILFYKRVLSQRLRNTCIRVNYNQTLVYHMFLNDINKDKFLNLNAIRFMLPCLLDIFCTINLKRTYACTCFLSFYYLFYLSSHPPRHSFNFLSPWLVGDDSYFKV